VGPRRVPGSHLGCVSKHWPLWSGLPSSGRLSGYRRGPLTRGSLRCNPVGQLAGFGISVGFFLFAAVVAPLCPGGQGLDLHDALQLVRCVLVDDAGRLHFEAEPPEPIDDFLAREPEIARELEDSNTGRHCDGDCDSQTG
jgi:hypothetical protein